ILLIPEARGEAELAEDAHERVAAGDLGLEFLAQLHDPGKHRAFEGDEGVRAILPDAQSDAPPLQRGAGIVEESIVLEAPRPEGHGADVSEGVSGGLGRVEPQFDFAFQQSVPAGRYSRRMVVKSCCPSRMYITPIA